MKEDEDMIERSSMKILLPVDGSLCSLAAAHEVAQRPWPKGSWVKILYVAERPLILSQVGGAMRGAARSACNSLRAASACLH
jgi:hypothetical protein